MDFNTKELQRAIAKLKGLVNTKSPYPAIKGIFYADGVMCATDMNVHAKVTVSTGLIPTDEKFIIPYIAFDAIGKLSADVTTITADARNNVTVSCGKFNTTFASVSGADFPLLDPSDNPNVSAEIDFNAFTKALNGVSYACSVDEKKGALVGVNMTANGGALSMVALDGFRAATSHMSISDMRSFAATVPEGFWRVLAKISSGENKVEFCVGEGGKSLSIKGEEFAVVTRTLDGAFPDVAKIIKATAPDKQIIVSKDDILHALDLHSAALKDSGANNLIVLTADPETNTATFTARNEASSFSYEIAAECNGFDELFRIGFNSKYLLDAIKGLADAEDVRLFCKSPVTGALIQDADRPDDTCGLVLPVRLNG